jgi:selenocysteine lyase/cysteine desulfurase
LRIRDVYGVQVRMCEEREGRIDPAELESLIDGNTRLVAVSHVQYASGFRIDLERLGRVVRQHDALFVVDAIQALGVLPVNVESDLIDVAAGASHKWLLGPEGVGYLYLSDRARDRIQPTLVGWVSVPDPDDYLNFDQGWNRGTLAWETGTGASALIHGLKASLELLGTFGAQKIANYLEELTDYLCDRLKANKNYEVVSSSHQCISIITLVRGMSSLPRAAIASGSPRICITLHTKSMSSSKHCHRTSERLSVGSTVALYGSFTSISKLCSVPHKAVTINKLENPRKNATVVFWAIRGLRWHGHCQKETQNKKGR